MFDFLLMETVRACNFTPDERGGEVALVAERDAVTSITVHLWVWYHLIIDLLKW